MRKIRRYAARHRMMAGSNDRQRCMVYLWMRYRIAEYAHWKEAFDTQLAARQAGGATRESLVMRNAADANEIVVLLGWNTLEQASAYCQSISLRAALHAMGVVGVPEVGFLETVV